MGRKYIDIRLYRRFAVIIGSFVLLGMGSSFLTPSVARADDNSAFVRVIHASPDIGTVDVFVDGKKLLSNFQFATVTDYVPLPAGTHNVQVALIGKGVDAAIVTQSVDMQTGTPYTISALGTKSSGFSFTVFTDDNVVTGTGAKFRVYHLAPGTATAQISMQSDTVVRDLSYAKASSYVMLASGTYTFNLTANSQDTLSSSLTLKPWTITSAFVIGMSQGEPKLQVVAAQKQGIPGMPQTGADPHAAPASSVVPVALLPYWSSSWFLVLMAALVLCGGCTTIVVSKARAGSAKRSDVATTR